MRIDLAHWVVTQRQNVTQSAIHETIITANLKELGYVW